MEFSILLIIYFLVGGIFAGLIGGMLGLGGGIIIVPLLHYIFVTQAFPESSLMQVAITTSLATVIITSLSATWIHHKKQAVIWSTVSHLAPGMLLGAALGAMLADSINSDILRIFFGIFEILVAIQIGFDLRPESRLDLPGKGGLLLSGSGIGFLSTLLGIGGGTITVPFLHFCRVPMQNAVAVSAACGIPIAVAGCVALLLSGLDNSDLPSYTIGYLYWPAALLIIFMTIIFAPIGAKLTHYLPVKILKRCFSAILFFVGLQMLFAT
ncbi:MAG: sulfite exporter TauE/SafE family protein [Pseudomonadota bacterium]